MSEIKVRLSLRVPGAQLLSSQECDKNPKKNYEYSKITLDGKGKKKSKETITIRTRKQGLVTHNINICTEAFNSMCDYPTSPKYAKLIKPKGSKSEQTIWSTMTLQERLKCHFDLIAHDFNATSYSYEILDD